MATGEDLAAQVLNKVQDASATDDDVLFLLNECIGLMTSEEDFAALHSVATVNTVADTDTADLPENCTNGVYLARVDGVDVKVYTTYADMHLALSEATGEIQGVTVDGETLRYLPIPAEVTPITIYYYRKAATITAGVAPDLFTGRERPPGERALVHYAAMRLYDDIEDGIEGAKVNTQRHEAIYVRAWNECKSQVRQGTVRPVMPVNKVWL